MCGITYSFWSSLNLAKFYGLSSGIRRGTEIYEGQGISLWTTPIVRRMGCEKSQGVKSTGLDALRVIYDFVLQSIFLLLLVPRPHFLGALPFPQLQPIWSR